MIYVDIATLYLSLLQSQLIEIKCLAIWDNVAGWILINMCIWYSPAAGVVVGILFKSVIPGAYSWSDSCKGIPITMTIFRETFDRVICLIWSNKLSSNIFGQFLT